jgi:ketosteroid isomerase-like protein
MEDQDNVKIVKHIQEAFKNGDYGALRQWLAEDVIWEVYGSEYYPLAGCYRGVERLGQLFEVFSKVVADFLVYELSEFIAHGNKVIVFGREKVRWFGGHTFEAKFIQVFTLHEGKVIEFHEACCQIQHL